ncbi:hypothetical protein BDK51DRAFT_27571 [Blyttiomyces helicus]|uniref:Chromo domain-containing protein n=1 Tax=Blyttiomyces helicus TaxID=388810 RepID=A0A4P9WID4_9FUNG|nr:hypothetical protein BDK51DRAFT_27571 [Blyttiomyces helicus]|eukprot:RKO92621.1 hypothetical protein BDK51DRAFT_27571 [Blyttiomyces helicus]
MRIIRARNVCNKVKDGSYKADFLVKWTNHPDSENMFFLEDLIKGTVTDNDSKYNSTNNLGTVRLRRCNILHASFHGSTSITVNSSETLLVMICETLPAPVGMIRDSLCTPLVFAFEWNEASSKLQKVTATDVS